jgi:hypothetical protein
LDEKEIDTSNIVIEKKEEKKVITSWVVNEADVKKILIKDFNMKEHETDFASLTDETINKQLEEVTLPPRRKPRKTHKRTNPK